MKRAVIYMSTSNLENAVQTLLNAGCLQNIRDAREASIWHFEHLFRITVEEIKA